MVTKDHIRAEGQGHKTLFELADPKKDYNNAKFEKPRLNSVPEKPNDNVFVKSEKNVNFISLEYVRKSKMVVFS